MWKQLKRILAGEPSQVQTVAPGGVGIQVGGSLTGQRDELDATERRFLAAYYKASCTSQPADWMQAAMMAKQMYNGTTRSPAKLQEEDRIYKATVREHEAR